MFEMYIFVCAYIPNLRIMFHQFKKAPYTIKDKKSEFCLTLNITFTKIQIGTEVYYVYN